MTVQERLRLGDGAVPLHASRSIFPQRSVYYALSSAQKLSDRSTGMLDPVGTVPALMINSCIDADRVFATANFSGRRVQPPEVIPEDVLALLSLRKAASQHLFL